MLTRHENERLARVGAGTPMGETMRRYWMPALLSWELPEPDGEPVRVRLLGEDLVAFRATDGTIGLIDEFCPHRGASLWLGRNEEGGLRCVYHGWKYDVTGRCVDQMNEPRQFCDKIRVKAYPTCELGGMVWTYMGPAGQAPANPQIRMDAGAGDPSQRQQGRAGPATALQALEGGIRHVALHHHAPGLEAQLPGCSAGPRSTGPACTAAARRRSRSTSPITATAISASARRTTARAMSRGYHFKAGPCRRSRSSVRCGRTRIRPMAITGSRWTTRPAWSGTSIRATIPSRSATAPPTAVMVLGPMWT